MSDDFSKELFRCKNVKTVSILPGKELKIICGINNSRCAGCSDYESEAGTDLDEFLNKNFG